LDIETNKSIIIMQDNEILKIHHSEVALTIVQDILFIGPNDEDSLKDDIAIEWVGENLNVGEYSITPAMVEILKLYINKQI